MPALPIGALFVIIWNTWTIKEKVGGVMAQKSLLAPRKEGMSPKKLNSSEVIRHERKFNILVFGLTSGFFGVKIYMKSYH